MQIPDFVHETIHVSVSGSGQIMFMCVTVLAAVGCATLSLRHKWWNEIDKESLND